MQLEPAVLNLWVKTSLGRGVVADILNVVYFTLQFATSKITVMKQQWNNCMVVGHRNMRSCIKGSQHVKKAESAEVDE